MHGDTARGQWAMELLQRTATPKRGSGQCNSCKALPRCLGVVGSATRAIHCLTTCGQCAVELLQCTAPLPASSAPCNSCNALPHRLGVVGSGTPTMRGPTCWGDGEPCPGRGRCLKTQLLQCNATLPGGCGQCNSCHALPHCLRAVGSATSRMHRLTAWGAAGSGTPAMHCQTAPRQWGVQLLQCTASMPWGSGQCNSCNALPHWLRAVGSATPAMLWLTARGQCAVQLLQCTAALLWGSGQCNSCNPLPHRPDAGTHAMRGHTCWGDGEPCLGGGRSP